ncbi:rab GDP dissociation inhibitor alpha [Platysternon megacephalum]|uniref:Rab GDP dissociation inhibitor alpha n=1 Tax=Platysternon megacephalum TaxID=55544 RepID=A0A4D9DMC1_9SAUR|nr:rab GDP dissociation inhibitor alpha [Platysternon megacephalum]
MGSSPSPITAPGAGPRTHNAQGRLHVAALAVPACAPGTIAGSFCPARCVDPPAPTQLRCSPSLCPASPSHGGARGWTDRAKGSLLWLSPAALQPGEGRASDGDRGSGCCRESSPGGCVAVGVEAAGAPPPQLSLTDPL